MSGSNHTVVVIKGNPTGVKMWGRNSAGQLGLGDNSTRTSPVLVPDLIGVKQVSSGYGHTAFLLEDGTVKVCGYNSYGQLGLGHTTDSKVPVVVPGLTGVKQVSCGTYHTLFLLNDGTVRACGINNYSQIGLGPAVNQQNNPAQVPGLAGIKQVSCGYRHTTCLLSDGTVKVFGQGSYGQLGTGNTTSLLSATVVPDLTGVKQVSSGEAHTAFLLNDGTVKVCGSSSYGQLGLGDNSTMLSPVLVLGLTGVRQVSCGGEYTAFLLSDGTVKVCGRGDSGQLGLGNLSAYTSPTAIPNLTGVKQVRCESTHVIFLLVEGTVKTCGYNSYGQLGLGHTTQTTSPTEVPSTTGVGWLAEVDFLFIEKFLIKKENSFIGKNNYNSSDTITNEIFDQNGLLKDEIITFINENNITPPFSLMKIATVNMEKLNVKLFKNYSILTSKSPISLTHLKEFNSINLIGSNVKIALSKNNLNWKKFNGTSWENVYINNSDKDGLYSSLNTPQEILALTNSQVQELVGTTEEPQFYLYIMFGSQGELDKISLNVDLKGYFYFAPSEITIPNTKDKVNIKFLQDGNYKVKYKKIN